VAIGRLGSLKTSSSVGINTFAILYTSHGDLTNVSINVTNQGLDDALFSVGICTGGLSGIRNSDYIVVGKRIKPKQHSTITNVGVSSSQSIFCSSSKSDIGFIAYGVQEYRQGVATRYGKENSLRLSLSEPQINTPLSIFTSSRKSLVTLVVTNNHLSDTGIFSVGISSGGVTEFSSSDYIIFGKSIGKNETYFIEKIGLGINQSLIIRGSIKDLVFNAYSLPADPTEDAFPSEISVSVATTITAYGQQTDTYGFYGNLVGNVSGNVIGLAHTGNLTGNVNSSGVSTFSGGILGNVTGNLTGNVTGNINSVGLNTIFTVNVTQINSTNLNVSGVSTLTGNVTIGSASSITVGDTFIKKGAIGLGTTTTAGLNAGVGTASGTMVYNSTDNIVEYYNGISWVSSGNFSDIDITGNANVLSWQRLWIDTTLTAITLTLPAAPYKGDTIKFFDLANTFNTNNLTIDRNGQKIQGDSDNMTVDIQGAAFELVYSGSTYGWKVFTV
jgi:hypothetical protein